MVRAHIECEDVQDTGDGTSSRRENDVKRPGRAWHKKTRNRPMARTRNTNG
jgi:hypothetical protein